ASSAAERWRVDESHGQSQGSEATPKITNTGRQFICAVKVPRGASTLGQSTLAISRPPTKVPKAGPRDRPMAVRPLATPRRCCGRCWAISFDEQGKATLSPRPSSRRRAISTEKLEENPV